MLLPVLNALSGLNERLLYMMQLVALVGGSLLLWRLWKYTVLPFLKPEEPKRLPYWIPCESQCPMPELLCFDS